MASNRRNTYRKENSSQRRRTPAKTNSNLRRSKVKKPRKKPRSRKSFGTRVLGILFGALLGLLTLISSAAAAISGFLGSLDARARKAALAGSVIFVGMTVFLVVFLVNYGPNAFEIYFNGNIAGIVEMRRHSGLDGSQVQSLLEQRLQHEVGEPVRCYDIITLVAVRSRDFVDLDVVVADMARRANFRVQAALIMVNGDRKATVANQFEADRLLESIRNEYYHPDLGITFIEFVESVEVVLDFVDVDSRQTYGQAKSLLTTPQRVEYTHIVQSGQTLSHIQEIYGMSRASILALNPEIQNPDNLFINQAVRVTRPRPVLSVRTVSEMHRVDVVPFEIQYIDDSTLPRNTTRTIQDGRDGTERITEHIIRENGILVSRDIVWREFIEPPVIEIIARGPRN